MKSFALMAAALFLGLTLNIGDAEARRLGGGSSAGMQRQSISPNRSANVAPSRNQAASPAGAQPKRSWMGPLAGLAAGLGLAALASHFGFGEGLANLMLIGLLVIGGLMLFRFLTRKKAGSTQSGMQYAHAGAAYEGQASRQPDFIPAAGSSTASAANEVDKANIPADFDADGFVRNAKLNFIRLQAANDAGNLDDIREFTTPEMFAEIKLGIGERGGQKQETDVVQLNAEVLDVSEEAGRYVVSVRFSGLIREERNAPAEPFDEMWHLTKPRNGSTGWVVAGIQQVQ